MKTRLKKALSGPAAIPGTNLLIAWSGQRLFLPFYHMVSDDDPVHVRHLYPAPTTKRFRKDLDFLQRHFRPVSQTALIDHVENRKPLTGNCFFLSFDDGLREFYDVAAPLLLDQGIPATCFVNTAFIDNRDMFYRMKASVLVDRLSRKDLSPAQHSLIVQLFRQHQLTFRDVSDLLKITDQNKDLLDTIAPVAGISFSEYLSTYKPYLTTPQIHELIGKGFSIGAHSVSHPFYQALPERMQVKQTLDCLDYLADNFSVQERVFSFPHTDHNLNASFFGKIKAHVDLSFGTAGLKTDFISTNLQRTPMEVAGYTSAEDIVNTEYLYFILKRLIGKHKIYRSW